MHLIISLKNENTPFDEHFVLYEGKVRLLFQNSKMMHSVTIKQNRLLQLHQREHPLSKFAYFL